MPVNLIERKRLGTQGPLAERMFFIAKDIHKRILIEKDLDAAPSRAAAADAVAYGIIILGRLLLFGKNRT